jgi:hypothetical protein
MACRSGSRWLVSRERSDNARSGNAAFRKAAPRALNALRYAGQADNDRDVRRSAQFAVEIITTNMRR